MTESVASVPKSHVTGVSVQLWYDNGAMQELSADMPQPCTLAVYASAEEAGLPPGMADAGRREPVVMVMFGGNPGAGGIQVHKEGVIPG